MQIVPKFPVAIPFHVTNIGKISFFYAWKYDEGQLLSRKVKLAIKDDAGQVTPESRVSCTMSVAKLAKTSFKNVSVDLEVSPDGNLVESKFKVISFLHDTQKVPV